MGLNKSDDKDDEEDVVEMALTWLMGLAGACILLAMILTVLTGQSLVR